jgi:hypothetical protein
MQNFRDTYCRVCNAAMEVAMHTLRQHIDGGLTIQTKDAPHAEESK